MKHILKCRKFDPVSFLGKGWVIDEKVEKWKGTTLDANLITTKDYLREGETYINGEERFKRIKEATGDIQCDAQDFMALIQEKGHVTLNWLYETKGITWLSFWGTILRSPGGRRSVLYLYRSGVGSWRSDYGWLAYDWRDSNPAAVLASSSKNLDSSPLKSLNLDGKEVEIDKVKYKLTRI